MVNVRFSNDLLTWYKSNDEKIVNQILNQILNTAYLSIENPNIQPGVFSDKMRGCVRYEHPN